MCGLAGIYTAKRVPWAASALSAMSDMVAHRGLDDHGFLTWNGSRAPRIGRRIEAGETATVLLAHRRLSIIDLTDNGWQPMADDTNECFILLNGEIYNYVELRHELERIGYRFRSASDTEVLLKGWQHWGPQVLSRLVGMFAFVILDTRARTLTLVRDQFGVKPLYYTACEDFFAFASEIRPLMALPNVSRSVSPTSLFRYLRFGYGDAGEGTLIADIRRLPAAHYVAIDLDRPVNITPQRYWSLSLAPARTVSLSTAAEELRELFLSSVTMHLRSDVRLGVALSGGIDSSAIACAARRILGDQELHAFSFVDGDPAISEEQWIDLVGKSARMVVHKVRVDANDFAREIDSILSSLDEPVASTSMFAQYHVYRRASKEGIKVVLDGQGADEMLAGYPNFFAVRFASLLQQGHLQTALHFLQAAGERASFGTTGILTRAGQFLLPGFAQSIARHLIGEQPFPPWLAANWFRSHGVDAAAHLSNVKACDLRSALANSFLERSLPGLLRYGDRNSMAHSVESRVPFLTPQIVQLVFSLPEEYLISKDATSKAVFRRAMRGIVPDPVLDRKDKIGFSTSQASWLQLAAPWVEETLLIAKDTLALDSECLWNMWRGLQSGNRRFEGPLWRCLNFLRWMKLNSATAL